MPIPSNHQNDPLCLRWIPYSALSQIAHRFRAGHRPQGAAPHAILLLGNDHLVEQGRRLLAKRIPQLCCLLHDMWCVMIRKSKGEMLHASRWCASMLLLASTRREFDAPKRQNGDSLLHSKKSRDTVQLFMPQVFWQVATGFVTPCNLLPDLACILRVSWLPACQPTEDCMQILLMPRCGHAVG